jgi:oligopeptide transport system substrate-binding protein
MKRYSLVVTLVLVLAVLISACGPAATPAATTVPPTAVPKPKVLRVNLTSWPDTIDPQKSSFVNEIAHLNLIYEGLTRFNEKLETVPGAAEKWEYNAAATVLTFTLRKGLKYSDGSLLNAARFAYSIKRNIDPNTAGEYAAITDEISGAPEWRGADLAKTSKADLAKLAAVVDGSVQALDASGAACKAGADGYKQEDCLTFKLTFSKPAPYFHTIMGIWVAYPAKAENIAGGGDIWWTSSKYQIGNGPFIVKSMEPYVRSRFEPNPNYWQGKANTAIEFSYITDSAVAFQAYKNNEFDIVTLAAEDLATVKKDAVLSKEANIYPGSCTYAMMYHQLKEPFTDKNVRIAFTQALDRAVWVNDVLSGLGSPTQTWIPKGYPGYKDGETRFGFDAAAAKAALAKSTYGTVDKLPPVTLTFADTPRNRTRNEWLAKKWKENLGVDIKLNPLEATAYTAATKDIKTAPQVFILGWCADYPDPQNWLSVYWKTGGFGERIGYSNKALDAILTQADTTTDPKTRMDLYQKAQDMLVDDAAVAFFWNNVNAYLVKPWVKGVKQTPQDAGFSGSYSVLTLDIDTAALPK